ncbi:hypothetical protein PanWU01x14_302690 [Parasponia andersonii]|uniref:Uncharacterized protein n=1 Tax=Parasponia andersonii TaxID=3476 RepID=A0A2P5AT94_PARAD|nr:hypothetical protein PanWU01x14_302690 [Parasponia andersonii]
MFLKGVWQFLLVMSDDSKIKRFVVCDPCTVPQRAFVARADKSSRRRILICSSNGGLMIPCREDAFIMQGSNCPFKKRTTCMIIEKFPHFGFIFL